MPDLTAFGKATKQPARLNLQALADACLTGGRKGPRLSAALLSCLFLLTLTVNGCAQKAKPLTPYCADSALPASSPQAEDLLSRLETMSPQQKKSELLAALNATSEPSLKAKLAYVLGRVLFGSGSTTDLAEAIASFRQATVLEPLWERSQWHIAECAAAGGDEKTARTALATITNGSSDPESKLAAHYALAQSYVRASETSNARQEFVTVQDLAPQSQFALGSSYYLAEMDLTDGKQSEAIRVLRAYLESSPDGRFAPAIVSRLSRLQDFAASSFDHDLFARVYFAGGQWAKALSEWTKAGHGPGEGNKGGKTCDWIFEQQATCLLNLGKRTQAKQFLADGIKKHPDDPSVPPAATALCRLLNRDGAICIWKNILQKSQNHADIALYNLAIRSPAATALAYYRQLATRYPDSAYAPEARWWLIWDEIQNGKLSAALSHCQQALTRYPATRASVRYSYWCGKILEKLKQKEQAKAAYKKTVASWGWHYYGHRAASRLAALTGKSDQSWTCRKFQLPSAGAPRQTEDWSWPLPPRQLTERAGPTVALLAELRQWDECLDLLKSKDVPELKAFFLSRLDLPLQAINDAGSKLKGAPAKTIFWQMAFPLLYSKQICAESSARGIDPLLVQALIREESRYDPKALSSSKAIGLMQLLPGTALGVAKRLGVPINSAADIHKPENNLKLGIDYLAYVLTRFKGNALLAVASYNGGPNAVKRWAANMPSDVDVFVENIPFGETRDYVRKVFGSYWNYTAIYKQ